MTWSTHSWNTISPIYNAILKMPFLSELANGKLDKEKFKFYMQQDSKYLENFGKTLSLIASKNYEINETLSFINFAETAIVAERQLHEFYFKDFNIVPSQIIEPVCHHYISHIKATAAYESVEVAMAAVLPCFWIYKKVGEHIYKIQESKNNPYIKWIETYAGDEFETLVQDAIQICDNAALNSSVRIRTRMTEVFVISSKLEYDFWNSAYQIKKWKEFS